MKNVKEGKSKEEIGNYTFACFRDFRKQVDATSDLTQKIAMVDAFMEQRGKLGFPVVEECFAYEGL